MVTLRTYWEPLEAALAKSVLEGHGIFCALFNENANLYGRAPIAMPVRLMVLEDEADRALEVLAGTFDAVADTEDRPGAVPVSEVAERDTAVPPDRPWELLVLAFYFLVPGVCVLQIKSPPTLAASRWGRYLIAKVVVFHFLSWLAIGVALLLIALFAYACHQSPRGE